MSQSLLKGTLDLLILSTLAREPLHGWGLTEQIEARSQRRVQVNPGSLYPSLERLQRRGWIRSTWNTTEAGRRARYYHLTAAGRRQLKQAQKEWRTAVAAVAGVLDGVWLVPEAAS